MREAIGLGQDQGRVALAEVVGRPHFWGIGALEGLGGEITIVNSVAIVTAVGEDGGIHPRDGSAAQATMLVGASVPEWSDVPVAEDVPYAKLDETVSAMAAARGADVSAPFLFLLEGDFTDVRLHVLNGACPIHARIAKIELPPDERPFEQESEALAGTLVGVYAAGSVGELTHPATSIHAHLVYEDATGRRVTGHVERAGVAAGAVLRLPEPSR
jgi:hypothetical protein